MTEEFSRDSGMTARRASAAARLARMVQTPLVLAYGTALAFAVEQGHQVGYADHFGSSPGIVDPRQAFLPFAMLVIGLTATAWIVVMLIRAGRALTVPGVAVGWLVVVVLLPPYTWAGLPAKAAVVVVVWLVVLMLKGTGALLRQFVAWADALPRGGRLATWFNRVSAKMEAVSFGEWGRQAGWAFIASAALLAGSLGGHWRGGMEARTQETFDVVRVDRGRQMVTVAFLGRDNTVYERTLDVSPDATGAPRNRWLPTLATRPLPSSGLTTVRQRLGPTKPMIPAPPP